MEEVGEERVYQPAYSMDTGSLFAKLQNMSEEQNNQKVWIYDTTENREEVRKKMSKLVLSVEMDNWEKAEMFAEALKTLLAEAPREVKSAALRLKMSVQKGDRGKTMETFDSLQQLLINSGRE